MLKRAQFNGFRYPLGDVAWGISGPHISTSENLHTKQKPVFSTSLRPFTLIFHLFVKFCYFLEKTIFPKHFEKKNCSASGRFSVLALSVNERILVKFLPPNLLANLFFNKRAWVQDLRWLESYLSIQCLFPKVFCWLGVLLVLGMLLYTVGCFCMFTVFAVALFYF